MFIYIILSLISDLFISKFCYVVEIWKTLFDCSKMETCKLFILSIVICLQFLKSSSEYSTEDCSALGYTKSNLLCTICDQLADFNLEILK